MVILVVQKHNLCGPVVRHVLITLARHQYFIFVLTKLPARTGSTGPALEYWAYTPD